MCGARYISKRAMILAPPCIKSFLHPCIMYNHTGENFKLINFGSASILSSKPYTHIRGTDINLPPEHYLCNKYYPRPCAVWAICCLTFCCLTSQTPFTSLNQILNTVPDWKLLANCQEDTFDFVLDLSESKRGSEDEVLSVETPCLDC